MDTHAEQLLKWNQKMNITAITDPEEVAIKHYVDAMAPVSRIPEKSALLDIGCGGGFPGIVLKIVMPSLQVTLVDASRKKVSFLKHVIHMLRLDGIDAHHVRGEHLPDQRFAQNGFDVVVSRAFSALDSFVSMAFPVLRENGRIIAMKGPQIDEELQTFNRLKLHTRNAALNPNDAFNIDVIQYQLPVLHSQRSLVIMKRLNK